MIITQSNLDDATQIQQMRQLVDQGVDAIIVCCSNPTALNQSVKYAHDKGVPYFLVDRLSDFALCVNSSDNYQLAGYQVGKWMADELRGKGNVMVVEGIPGTSGSDSQDRGMKAGLATAPGIKVVGDVAGMWTDQVAQGEVQKWLATNPGELDGIVVQSAAEIGVLRALQQSGRKMVPVASAASLALCAIGGKTPNTFLLLSRFGRRRRVRADLEHHDAHARGPGPQGPVDHGRSDQADLCRHRKGASGQLQHG